MKIENEKLKTDYDTRMSSLSEKLESVKFDNANLLKKNSVLCTRIKEMEGKIESVEQMSIDSIRKGNWNEQ
jgi:predicted nuclease with TOPRIM domain